MGKVGGGDEVCLCGGEEGGGKEWDEALWRIDYLEDCVICKHKLGNSAGK